MVEVRKENELRLTLRKFFFFINLCKTFAARDSAAGPATYREIRKAPNNEVRPHDLKENMGDHIEIRRNRR